MTTAWLTKCRVKPWRLAYYRAAFLAARDNDPDLKFSGWIREACDSWALAQFGETKMPSPEHLFFDKASRRRRGDDGEVVIAAANDVGFDEMFGPPKD